MTFLLLEEGYQLDDQKGSSIMNVPEKDEVSIVPDKSMLK